MAGDPFNLQRFADAQSGGVYEQALAEIHAGEKTYVIRERMQTLEERLDPAHFVRIHRSIIVRLDRIEALLRGAGGDYAVRLRSGVKLKVSRGRFEELEERMGVSR